MTIDTDKLKALALAEFLAWAATEEGNCDRHDLRQNPVESHERMVDGETFISILVERDWTVWKAAQRGLIAERDELRAEVERLRAAQTNSASKSSSNCAACEGSPSGDNNPCAVCGRAAPAAGPEKDTARLDFMIAEECQIEHIDTIGFAPLYRVRWPWEEREMRAWSATPREAIDAAISAKGAPCGS